MEGKKPPKRVDLNEGTQSGGRAAVRAAPPYQHPYHPAGVQGPGERGARTCFASGAGESVSAAPTRLASWGGALKSDCSVSDGAASGVTL